MDMYNLLWKCESPVWSDDLVILFYLIKWILSFVHFCKYLMPVNLLFKLLRISDTLFYNEKYDAIFFPRTFYFFEKTIKNKNAALPRCQWRSATAFFAAPVNGHELQRLSLRIRHRAHCPPQSRLLVNAFEEERRERKLARGEEFWIISKKSANECREYKAGCICVDEMVVQGFMII